MNARLDPAINADNRRAAEEGEVSRRAIENERQDAEFHSQLAQAVYDETGQEFTDAQLERMAHRLMAWVRREISPKA